ncbi:MAG: nickel pincer cofactor biosynthesis protein LarB [Planctomycetes bacterium]|nr:nickel pincer cofactor biosynthesis protein LarB [Planctomycetota bacterium]
MNPKELKLLMRRVAAGKIAPDEAAERLRTTDSVNLHFARVDTGRESRCGFPEVIFGARKSPKQIAQIAAAILRRTDRLLVTRASEEAFLAVREIAPEAKYYDVARIVAVRRGRAERARRSMVFIVTAGTSDIPVAEEARVTALMFGVRVETAFDCGVAGLHRLIPLIPTIRKARAIIVIAGMEGALASVVGGLVRRPVIAVPTSVGYGASFGGIAPLLTMMNSCAAGVSVVNIDNGFGAGYLAGMIARA